MPRVRVRFVPRPRVTSLKIDEDTHAMLAFVSRKLGVAMTDLAEVALRLLFEALRDPRVVDVSRVSDSIVKRFFEEVSRVAA